MMPTDAQQIKEALTWVQWWAFPWASAHDDWRSVDKYAAADSLYRNGVRVTHAIAGIAPCLPPAPEPTVLRLVLASTEQLDLILSLSRGTLNPVLATSLSQDQQLWCLRLSRALAPDMLLPSDDPLQLLRNWVKPAIWQRLRLRFPYKRVLETEKNTSLENGHNRLDTLWQAVVWRATTLSSDAPPPDSNEQGT
jgi:hypothetical protein